MDLSLSTLSANAFLMLYIALLGAACGAAFAISIRMRPDGQSGALADMVDLAILSGGRQRFVDAVAAKLIGNGSLELLSNGEFTVLKPNTGGSSAERAVLRMHSPFNWPDMAEAVRVDGVAFEHDLVRKGWLMDESEALRLRVLQATPFLVLLAFGFVRVIAGGAEGEPVGALSFFMFGTAAAAGAAAYFLDRKTNAGQDVLAMNSDDLSRLKRAPESGELGHAVALYGTGILAGTTYANLHVVKAQQAGGGGCGGGGGDTGDDGGGSGCSSGCGGGCGGCGG